MKRLTTAFLDVFLILLLSCVVMIKAESTAEENPESQSYFIVTTEWETTNNDVDVWGKIVSKEGSDCGFTSREKKPLRLHGDWTSMSYMDRDTAFETMTIDSLEAGEYGFALHGYRVFEPTEVHVTIVSTKPFRVIYDEKVTVYNAEWTSLTRVTINKEGKVLSVNSDLPVDFVTR